ncbi:hypothetical protein JXO59_00410 [candidate division KSB1 bacterium]|nr:hypothetical protein [candidate division KSB1 bacterium]
MKDKISFGLFVGLFVYAITFLYGLESNPAKIHFTKQKLQEDFRQMRQTLEQNHAALYEYTAKGVMDSLFDRQFSLIQDSMALREFFVLLTPIIAKIGCGHTNVWMPMDYWNMNSDKLFPLHFRLIEDRMVVTGSYTGEEQLPRGSILLEINGRACADIIAEMTASYPADAMNPHFAQSQVERRFPMIYSRRFGFPEAYRVTYALPGRKTRRSRILTPAHNEAVRDVVFKNFRNPELSLRLLTDRNAAVLRIETFIYYDRVTYFTHFIDSCFTVIHDKKIANLILDLRGNDGGDPFCAAPLFSYLEPEPLPYFAEPYGKYAEFAKPIPRAEKAFKGNLLTLLDGRCFSTNAHFCALLKYHRIGRFIGTPGGATYKCNAGKNTHIDLKNTGIMLYFGRSTFAVAVEGMDKSQPIMPDVLVKESYRDFLEEKDIFMDTAFKFISN